MENKIFVIYVGVLKIHNDYIDEYVRHISEKIKPSTFKGEILIIPDFLSVNTRIECINPKYITKKELIDEHTKSMETLEEFLNEEIKKGIEINKLTDNDKTI
jgi:hypothetical protein